MLRRILGIIAMASFFGLALASGSGCGGAYPGGGEFRFANLSGVVLNAATSQPVAGARVFVTSDGSVGDVVTDASGRYQVVAMPVAEARIQVFATGFANLDTRFTLREGENRLDLRLAPL